MRRSHLSRVKKHVGKPMQPSAIPSEVKQHQKWENSPLNRFGPLSVDCLLHLHLWNHQHRQCARTSGTSPHVTEASVAAILPQDHQVPIKSLQQRSRGQLGPVQDAEKKTVRVGEGKELLHVGILAETALLHHARAETPRKEGLDGPA
jgi:hypothetical protein